MRFLARGAFLIALASVSIGCKTCDLVEAELRYQTTRAQELENLIAARESEIITLRSTVDNLHSELEQRGTGQTPEAVYREMAMSKLDLGRATGGRDSDRDGFMDSLCLFVSPIDFDGDPFKCPGSVSAWLYEFMPNGAKHEIGHWEFDPAGLRESWRSTIMGTGYRLIVPWKVAPTQKKLRTVVKFTTLDGRVFEAERDFEIVMGGGTAPVETEEGVPHPIAPPASTLDFHKQDCVVETISNLPIEDDLKPPPAPAKTNSAPTVPVPVPAPPPPTIPGMSPDDLIPEPPAPVSGRGNPLGDDLGQKAKPAAIEPTLPTPSFANVTIPAAKGVKPAGHWKSPTSTDDDIEAVEEAASAPASSTGVRPVMLLLPIPGRN